MACREREDHIFGMKFYPKSQSLRKQKHPDLTPHTRQHTPISSLYHSPEFLKAKNFKDIPLYSGLQHISESRIVRCTDSHSRNAALSTLSTVLPKPRLINGGHQKLWEIPVSKCFWLSPGWCGSVG